MSYESGSDLKNPARREGIGEGEMMNQVAGGRRGKPLFVAGSWFLVLGSWFLVLGSWFPATVNCRDQQSCLDALARYDASHAGGTTHPRVSLFLLQS